MYIDKFHKKVEKESQNSIIKDVEKKVAKNRFTLLPLIYERRHLCNITNDA